MKPLVTNFLQYFVPSSLSIRFVLELLNLSFYYEKLSVAAIETKVKICVLLVCRRIWEYESSYFHIGWRIWIIMPINISLPLDTLRDFLHKPLDGEESCTPKVHTLDHMNKRARFTERERKCTHTAITDRICCCLDRRGCCRRKTSPKTDTTSYCEHLTTLLASF